MITSMMEKNYIFNNLGDDKIKELRKYKKKAETVKYENLNDEKNNILKQRKTKWKKKNLITLRWLKIEEK